MGKTGTVKHTHQYFKRTDGMWACDGRNEGCTHYMPKNMAPLPMGRLSICWNCEKEFQLLPNNMKDAHPNCDECLEKADTLEEYMKQRLEEAKNKSKSPISNLLIDSDD